MFLKRNDDIEETQINVPSNRSSDSEEYLLSEHGIVYLNQKQGESSEESFLFAKQNIMRAFMSGFGECKDNRITLYINTYGSAIDEAIGLYDTIVNLRKKHNACIYTVAQGYAFSAGAIVLQAGTKRLATENSFIMLHTVQSSGIDGSASEIKKGLEYALLLDNTVLKILTRRSALSQKELISILAKKDNWYLSAKEALQFKLIDEII